MANCLILNRLDKITLVRKGMAVAKHPKLKSGVLEVIKATEGTTVSHLIGIANQVGLDAYITLAKSKSTSLGRTRKLEDAANEEQDMIDALITALKGKSKEVQDRVLQLVSDSITVPEAHLNTTSGGWDGKVAVNKGKPDVSHMSYDDALALLLKPSNTVYKSGEAASVETPIMWGFSRGKWG